MDLIKLLYLCIVFCISLICCKSVNEGNYDNLTLAELKDTNVYFLKRYRETGQVVDFEKALKISNLLIKKDSANFDFYLNKFNILSYKPPYKHAIAFNDSVFSKFKSDTSLAITLLLAKGHLQQVISDNKSKDTYLLADKFAQYSISKSQDIIDITRYITYVTTGALAYNADTVNNRIEEYKKTFPNDTATINKLLKIK